MSTERDELADVIKPAAAHDYWPQKAAELVLAAGYRKPQQVTTAEELDKLGFYAVVLDAYGTPYVCERHRTDGTRNEWQPAGMNHMEESENILYHGPATVLHVGGAA